MVAYQATQRRAAAGVDGVTWEMYGENLEENVRDLSARLKRGAYRAKPVRRVYIDKADGSRRPLGVPTVEDKVVQRATSEVLGAVYEQDFLGFSYGFRPGRSPHDALDALSAAITKKKVNWVLDADIRGFYDALDHEWLVKFVEHRIGDRRVIRLIQKWLKAGVLEDGERKVQEKGAVQGGSISPLLANVYLHYVFDLWVQQWRKQVSEDVVVVRFADDIVVGFDFLGFTHICGKTRRGKFVLRRKTSRKKLRAKLKEVKEALRRRWNWSVPKLGAYLRAVVRGHTQYFGVPFNSQAIVTFRFQVSRIWPSLEQGA